MTNKRHRRVVGALSVAALVAGCAITPEPMTELDISHYAKDKRSRVVSDQEPVHGAIGLYEAMARALKYNLDKEVEVMETLLKHQQLRLAHASLLPAAVAETGYASRSNYSGGSSVRLDGPRKLGPESLTASTSSELDVRTADLKFSWHILDFGLSYVRARQAADQVLIAEESRRRVVNRIVENVRTAYWRAVSATRLRNRLGSLEGRVNRALKDTRALVSRGDSSPLTALTYERELVEIQREIRKLDAELSAAKAQLAALINIDPGKPYSIVVPSRMPLPKSVGLAPEEMVATALTHRSELREVAYQQRINVHEAEAAILEMLPGASLNGGPSWNSNRFLFNNNWVAWGASASWNIIKVFTYPERRAEVRARDDLLDQRALAVTMAIMTQVHVSRARLVHARREFDTARRYHDVQTRIVQQIRAALDAGKVSEQTAIREEMNALVSTARLDLAYAELQSAFAAVHASMGLTPLSEVDRHGQSVSEMTKALRSSWRQLGDRLG